MLRLGELHRLAVADLAQLRLQAPGDPVQRRLESLVLSSRATVYPARGERGSLAGYLLRGYWGAVRERGRPLLLAWICLLLSAVLGVAWARHDPLAASGIVPGSLAGGSPHQAIGLGTGQAAELSVTIFTNNITVTFLAFASGILLGLGPLLVLLYNGLLLGVVGGLASDGGHTTQVVELVAPHGLLELSCIAVCAAAGMRMGWRVVEPGDVSRQEALADEAQRAVLVVLCTMPWLVLAGLIEGFVTPRRLPLPAALGVSLAAALPYWLLVARGGASRDGHLSPAAAHTAHNRSLALARR